MVKVNNLEMKLWEGHKLVYERSMAAFIWLILSISP